MAAGHDARPGTDAGLVPSAFRDAVAAMRGARVRPEVHLEEMPAPRRIAPYAAAVTGDVEEGEEEVATGRLILLHDPDGNDAWEGTFRCVTYVRADIEGELATDPMLAEVGWSWLREALEAHGAGYVAAAGTVTCVTTRGFGQMSDDETTAQIEIRASWSPSDLALDRHTEAWAELMCQAAGLPPLPDGVALLPSRRQRGRS